MIPLQFREVGEHNSCTLLEAKGRYPTVGNFMEDEDLRIPIFSSVVDTEAEQIETMYDIDGVVVEISRPSAVRPHIHFLKFPPVMSTTITKQWGILKKRFPLTNTTVAFREQLLNVRGMCLGMSSTGHFLNLTVVPKPKQSARALAFESEAVRLTIEMLGEVREAFVKSLKECEPQDLARLTMKKNSLWNPSIMEIMWEDQEFVFDLLNGAVKAKDNREDVTFLLTLTKFGMRDHDPLDLRDLVQGEILSVSLHFAMELMANTPDTVLFWVRAALEEWAGQRGTFFPAFGLSEAANFRSRVEVPIPASPGLSSIITCQEGLQEGHFTFLQVYSDSPHTHPKGVFRHPVSGAVGCVGQLHWKTTKQLHHRAANYITHFCELATKLRAPFGLRIEHVRYFEIGEEEHLVVFDPATRFNADALGRELRKEAIVVPFVQTGASFKEAYTDVLDWHLTRLHTILHAREGKGGYLETWKAFQSELALEEVFYGRPLALEDTQLSSILGTSADRPKSLTCIRGFPALSPCNSATSEVSPPPLKHWTGDKRTADRIRQMFTFVESVSAAPPIVWEALWEILLQDLQWRQLGKLSLKDLQGADAPSNRAVVGGKKPEELVDKVLGKKAYPFPMLFQAALDLVVAAGSDPKTCLLARLQEVRWFPAFKIWETRNPRVSWNLRGVEQLYTDQRPLTIQSKAGKVEEMVLVEMERRGLMFASKLAKYQSYGMAWMQRCLERLLQAVPKFSTEDSLKVMTFVSCIGMLMNNDYVDFQTLKDLHSSLPCPQSRLQDLNLLSKSILPCRAPLSLWKLSHTIPHRLPARPKVPRAEVEGKRPLEEPKEQREEEDVMAHNLQQEVDEEARIVKRGRRFYPGNTN